MCKRVYHVCSHAPYTEECAAKYEEASCCFGGGGGCRGIEANITAPEYCPDCKAKQAASRAARNHSRYGHSYSSSRGANRLNNSSSCDSIIEPSLMHGVAAMPGMGTYDTRRRQPPPVQPAYYPQGRRTRDAPRGHPVARDMPSVHEASYRPQVQRGYVAAQPMSATVVFPTPPSYHHNSQRRQQQHPPPQMSSVPRHEPPSFGRHMRQQTMTTTQRMPPQAAPPARLMIRRHAAPQRAPQPLRKPIRRDSNGVSECGSDYEDERRDPSTPSPMQATFHAR
ncbi:hypothetical protein PG994_010779 [Apiospora phragmitis]|uniref:Uncharacterized protein n=1 Tax=Apiospora phragmitis TaxID=2905665 RepID=A0ABR1TQW8_9PEZI